jgi:hypothetical protein
MSQCKWILKAGSHFAVAVLAAGICIVSSEAQTLSPAQNTSGSESMHAPKPPASQVISRPQPARLDQRAVAYYAAVWGIEDPSVKWAESGELVRFSYRILDPEKVKILNDKKLEPKLVDPEKGVELVVPSLENVGALRQSSTPIAGKIYWMAFSNPGRPVKKGDRVSIVIGNFHAVGLIVE